MLTTSSLLWNFCQRFLHFYASPSSRWQNFFLMRREITFQKKKKRTLLHERLRIFSHLEICDFRTFPSACASQGGEHWRREAAAPAFVGKQNFVLRLNAQINEVASVLHPSGHLSFGRCFQGARNTGTHAVPLLSARRAAADVIGSYRLGELLAGTLKLTRNGAGNETQRASPNRARRRRAGGSIFQVDEFQGRARRMRRRVQETLGGGGGGGGGASGRI